MQRSMKSALLLLVSGLALLGSGCTLYRSEMGEPAGSVTLHSPTLGNVTLNPTLCESGERELFYGADFFGNQGITLRLIVEPTGAQSLRFFDAAHPLNPGTLFRRQDCSRFELSLEHTNLLINEVRDLPVSLTFECRTASGETATGHLVAAHCH
ncbi:MAG: hypothetical protein QOF89_4066 [Acidobacteriota bacterium]|nr:hypothetical protein [Acidobacteriota bacterium]